MDIGKIDGGAWLTLQPKNEQVGEVRLRVLPIPTAFSFPEEPSPETVIDVLGKFIIEWNMELDGVAIPCNDETKSKYLSFLIRLEVKVEGGAEPEFAVTQIARFAKDIENFLKN